MISTAFCLFSATFNPAKIRSSKICSSRPGYEKLGFYNPLFLDSRQDFRGKGQSLGLLAFTAPGNWIKGTIWGKITSWPGLPLSVCVVDFQGYHR